MIYDRIDLSLLVFLLGYMLKKKSPSLYRWAFVVVSLLFHSLRLKLVYIQLELLAGCFHETNSGVPLREFRPREVVGSIIALWRLLLLSCASVQAAAERTGEPEPGSDNDTISKGNSPSYSFACHYHRRRHPLLLLIDDDGL